MATSGGPVEAPAQPFLAFAAAEFDIDKGNSLVAIYPVTFEVGQFDQTNFADLCLPDGAHIHSEDWTYLFLHRTATSSASQLSLTASQSSLASTTGSFPPTPLAPHAGPDGADALDAQVDPSLVYGLSFFKKKSDKLVKRGAVQKALLCFASVPAFAIFEPLLRAGVDEYLEGHDVKGVLKTMYTTLTKAWGRQKEVTLFGKTFPLVPTPGAPVLGSSAATSRTPSRERSNSRASITASSPAAAPAGGLVAIPKYKPDEFDGASLTDLVQRFGVDTMYLWYTLLLEQRILFSGQPAHLVGPCCLACPLLVAPLRGFTSYIFPYVSLTDLKPLERSTYIAGTTNSLLETKTEWYDMMASFSTGIVRKNNAKLSSLDKEFILNVLSGIKAGEQWVRTQFRNYTKAFLDSVRTGQYLNREHATLGEPFKVSRIYETYAHSQLDKSDEDSAGAALSAVESLLSTSTLLAEGSAATKVKQALWELLQKLVDLQTIDRVIKRGGVLAVAPLLQSNSAQIRKYAVAILAQLATSMKGQVSIVQHNIIPRVVLMLRDPMPNAASAAAYALYKISTLYIGVAALVHAKVPRILLQTICSTDDNLVLKISSAETLIQIHKLDPSCPIVGREDVKALHKSVIDLKFKALLCQLLDLWGEERIPIKPSDATQLSLMSLRSSAGASVRAAATTLLLSDLAQDPTLVLEFIAGGGVQVCLQNVLQTDRTEPLARLSLAILCIIADTSMGRAALVGNNVMEAVVAEFERTEFPLHLYYVARFFEVCAQHRDAVDYMLRLKTPLPALLNMILKYAEKPTLRPLVLPCLGALKYMMLLNGDLVAEIGPQCEALKALYLRLLAALPPKSATGARIGSVFDSFPLGSAHEKSPAPAPESPGASDPSMILPLLRVVLDLADPTHAKKLQQEGYETAVGQALSEGESTSSGSESFRAPGPSSLPEDFHARPAIVPTSLRAGSVKSGKGTSAVATQARAQSPAKAQTAVAPLPTGDILAAAENILADLESPKSKTTTSPKRGPTRKPSGNLAPVSEAKEADDKTTDSPSTVSLSSSQNLRFPRRRGSSASSNSASPRSGESPGSSPRTDGGDYDSEVDQFLAGTFKQLVTSERKQAALKDKAAAATALNLDLDEIDRIATSMIAEQEQQEAKLASSALSTPRTMTADEPGSVDPNANLDTLVKSILGQTPENSHPFTPRNRRPEFSPPESSEETEEDQGLSPSTRRNRRSAPSAYSHHLPSILGFLAKREAKDATPKPQVSMQKWNDIADLMDDIMADRPPSPTKGPASAHPAPTTAVPATPQSTSTTGTLSVESPASTAPPTPSSAQSDAPATSPSPASIEPHTPASASSPTLAPIRRDSKASVKRPSKTDVSAPIPEEKEPSESPRPSKARTSTDTPPTMAKSSSKTSVEPATTEIKGSDKEKREKETRETKEKEKAKDKDRHDRDKEKESDKDKRRHHKEKEKSKEKSKSKDKERERSSSSSTRRRGASTREVALASSSPSTPTKSTTPVDSPTTTDKDNQASASSKAPSSPDEDRSRRDRERSSKDKDKRASSRSRSHSRHRESSPARERSRSRPLDKDNDRARSRSRPLDKDRDRSHSRPRDSSRSRSKSRTREAGKSTESPSSVKKDLKDSAKTASHSEDLDKLADDLLADL